ncbi:MAG: histidine kinase [Candidatus Eremiobacteraeota bacterium]|nr:histidine kinase [Candidatus Eremiobacteraeota bacterium]
MLRTVLSIRGLILALALVAVGLPVALIGQLGIARTLNATILEIARIRQAQLALAGVLQLQVDEESGIRGYAATRSREFLEPYRAALRRMPLRMDELQDRLRDDPELGTSDRAVVQLEVINAAWLHSVGQPVTAGKPLDSARTKRGKQLIDSFRGLIVPIEQRLDVRYRARVARREATIRMENYTAVGAIALLALEVIGFAIVIARMRDELDRDRAVVESLQTAVSARLVPPEHLRIGAAYRSATRGARVGGDVYDVYRLDDDRTLLVVGDVSGKGLTAAVDTMFVRFALRALASESLTPDGIVERFDRLYRDANGAPESFVTLFVGIHDRRDGSLAYANAGHEACWIRRNRTLQMLPPTGPIVGLGGFPFAAAAAALGAGDLLILATDGLTEARDPEGGFIPTERLNAWLERADAVDPQRFVDEVASAVARYTHGKIVDDLALLAVAPAAKEKGTL